MRYVFQLDDEKTVSNDTVKVMLHATGPVDKDSRANLETRVRKALKEFLPDVTWVFGGFTFDESSGYPMFVVPASARISAELNDDLTAKAQRLDSAGVRLSVYNIDQSIPLHLIRTAEESLRLSLLNLANEELKRVQDATGNSKLSIQSFSVTKSHSGGGKGSMSVANSYTMEVGASRGDSIEYSEKVFLQAAVVLSDEDDAIYKIVRQ
jgi:hypothetical protein